MSTIFCIYYLYVQSTLSNLISEGDTIFVELESIELRSAQIESRLYYILCLGSINRQKLCSKVPERGLGLIALSMILLTL